MVVAAIVVRRALDDGDASSLADDGREVLVCATDLAAACDALGSGVEVRLEAAAETAAAIESGTVAADVDAWVTTTAWVEVVAARSAGGIGELTAVAASPTVVATAPGRFEAIAELCGGQDVWSCLGSAAGRSWADLGDGTNADWRELKVGLTDPDSATGLSVLASAAVGYFGGTDFAANDPSFLDFEGWLATLAEPSMAGDENPARTLVTRPGTYSAAGSVAAVAGALSPRGVGTIEPATGVSATVVVMALPNRGQPGGLGSLGAALVDQGWTRTPSGDTGPTLKPGVMAALHSLWRDVTT